MHFPYLLKGGTTRVTHKYNRIFSRVSENCRHSAITTNNNSIVHLDFSGIRSARIKRRRQQWNAKDLRSSHTYNHHQGIIKNLVWVVQTIIIRGILEISSRLTVGRTCQLQIDCWTDSRMDIWTKYEHISCSLGSHCNQFISDSSGWIILSPTIRLGEIFFYRERSNELGEGYLRYQRNNRSKKEGVFGGVLVFFWELLLDPKHLWCLFR